MSDQTEVWRWNSDPVWHYFCSLGFETHQARFANNDLMRYHHLRSSLYFAVCTIESLLNREMRRHLEQAGTPEEAIVKWLRRPSLARKREEWPSEICGKSVAFARDIVDIIETNRSIRDEVTHPKRRDHSIYVELEQVDAQKLVTAVARAIVTLCEGMGVPFQYWVLGWNYVGMNGNPAHPVQLNNGNGFVWSLDNMGFNIRPSEVGWDRRNMISIAHYEALKAALQKYPEDIEPYWPVFPTRPRLTRRWWDHEFINANVAHAQKVAETNN